MEIKLAQINASNLQMIEPLANEAICEGYRFVQRAIDEWKNNVNIFSKKGELLIGILLSDRCIGIGGLNVDPYIDDPNIGRIRHVYISKSHRRKGYASILVKKLIEIATKHFIIVRLYTNNPIASAFYESVGFIKSNGFKVSHILKSLN